MSRVHEPAATMISTPSGGGALNGLGEKFAPDPHTGTGNFTLPVGLPPGRNGFGPELDLVYSTGHGNGPFGLGWRLSLPGVGRKTSQGVPRYDDTRDTFVLSGSEDLVSVEQDGARTRYRPRTEGAFAQIVHHRDADSDFWEVHGKDGLRSVYGKSAAVGNDPPLVANPEDRRQIFAWKIAETRDPFGNRIVYRYRRDSGLPPEKLTAQTYLEQIQYVDFADETTGEERFLVSVDFIYEDRPDPFSGFSSGFEIRTRRRCRRIEVRTHADPDGSHLFRAYEFVYLDQRVATNELPSAELPLNGVSLLSQVKVVGRDDDEEESLPPLEFAYTRFEPEGRDFSRLEGPIPGFSLANPDLEMADLTGNGLPDFLQMGAAARYWSNLGDGRFDQPREMRDAPAGFSLAEPGVQLLDADGDARIDLMVTRNGLSGYFPLRHDGEWDRRSFRRHRQAPSFNLQGPDVKLLDLDGDGVTDAVRSGSRFECFFNHADEGWNRTRRVPRRMSESSGGADFSRSTFPDVSFSDPRLKWADMTGDGLQDIVLVHDGNVEYWPNLGHGDWGRRIHMKNSPRFPSGYNPGRILVGDIDGDGVADLVYVDHCKVTLWISRSGNAWSDPIEIDGTPPVSDRDVVRLSDAYGTGTQGVLWSKEQAVNGLPRLLFLDLTAKVKPYLLNTMDNRRGAVTRVAYDASTKHYLEDKKQHKTWKATLPFPVQVVSRVEVIDELSGSKLSTEYRYHHGYWDGAEREFRGFGMVEQFDTETFEIYNGTGLHGEGVPFERVEQAQRFSAPTLTKTWFHQGPVGEAHGDWEEPDWSEEFWTGDPHFFRHRENLNAFLRGLPDRRARRDALRSLRSHLLRSELYALDGSERADRPYTVTERSYGVREIEPPLDGDTHRRRIFFPHALAKRATQWERGLDPMTELGFTEGYDAYGQPRTQIGIAVPRGRDFREAAASAGEPYLVTHNVTDYAQIDTDTIYIVDRVARATTYEIPNDGTLSAFDLKQRVAAGAMPRKVIGDTLNFYDGPAFSGLPLGTIGERGVLKRSESLALTDDLLNAAYPDGDPTLTAQDPPYFAHADSPPWPGEYPSTFAASHPVDQHADDTRPGLGITPLGYGFADGSGYYVASQRLDHDAHGLVVAQRDPLGRDAADRDVRIHYDAFGLFAQKVTDAAGLETLVEYDYRVLQPKTITNPNGNVQEFAFSPLGLPTAVLIRGKNGEGDSTQASSRFDYDLWAFENSPSGDRQPSWVRTIRRERHDSDPDAGDATIETVEYSDGFGRLLQTRVQSEDVIWGDDAVFGNAVLPADQSDAQGTSRRVQGRLPQAADQPNVVVSGWVTYDNKGRAVERYEPFFAQGWNYFSRDEAVALRENGETHFFGEKVTLFYDPRGQVIRTVNPDGSEKHVVYGRPMDLVQPETFQPTPWEAYAYDANDNAGRTHQQESSTYAHHWNTPSSIQIDALGRTIRTVTRNRGPNPDDASEEVVTRSAYDIRGNLLAVTDALGRGAFSYRYDLTNQTLRIDSIDAGLRRIVLDAAGNEIERRDTRQALVLQEYDRLHRPTRVWARDDAAVAVTLRQRLEYGDDETDRDAARANNRLGQLLRHHDEAGMVTVESYDFKGNVLAKKRRVIRDEHTADCFTQGGVNDWQANDDVLLEADEYTTSMTYDALERVVAMRYPEDANSGRAELRPSYNRAGALQSVTLDGEPYVERIAYNAKGQRSFIAYGNGLWTRYAYDRRTFQLARLQTGKYLQPDAMNYKPDGGIVQDLAYRYDLVGNAIAIDDRSPMSGVGGTGALERTFEYDPLYRLTLATGREYDRNQQPIPLPPWLDTPTSQDAAATRAYTQTYTYDPVDNLTRLDHGGGPHGSFVRRFNLAAGNNRLEAIEIGQDVFATTHDLNGSLVQESTSRHFIWNHSDQLRAFRIQAGSSDPSVQAHYLYDAAGQRVKKLVRKGVKVETTTYIDGHFERHRWKHGSAQGQNDQLHVMDDQRRIALVRRGPAHPNDTGPAIQFNLGDHLGSSSIIVGDDGRWTNREEYYPYGETSFGSFARKRHRFTGMERDEESALNYHGARYFAAYLCRWTSCDPIGLAGGMNQFVYANDNPMVFTDTNGQQPNEESDASKNIKAKAKADKVEAAAFDKTVGRLRDPAPAPSTNSEKSVLHNVMTDEHNEKVAKVVNTALELSGKRHTDSKTGKLTASKYTIASHAKGIVTDWRNNSKKNANNLIFRDADHYLTGYTQEWQKHLPGVTDPENNKGTSNLSDTATSIYNNKKELHFKIAAVFDPEGVDTFDSGLEPFDANDPPPSAPGGSHWPALGAEHFRRDFKTLNEREVPTLLPASPFLKKASRGEEPSSPSGTIYVGSGFGLSETVKRKIADNLSK